MISKAVPEFKVGDWISDGLVRGQVIRIGVMGKRIPTYLVSIGGGRTTLIPTNIAEPLKCRDMTIEIACKFHEYEVLMDEVEFNIYECPICGALCIARHDPIWSTVDDGVSWELTWMSRGVRVEDVA